MRRILLAALLVQSPQLSSADPLENAHFLCDLFDKTGVSSECEVSHVTANVDVIIATNEAEAANVCSVIVNKMVEKGRSFGGQWTLRIYAPERRDTPLAVCALR